MYVSDTFDKILKVEEPGVLVNFMKIESPDNLLLLA
jgi:hypothetical protein